MQKRLLQSACLISRQFYGKRRKASSCAFGILLWCIAAPCLATEDRGPRRFTTINGLSWSPNGDWMMFSTNRNYEDFEACYLWRVKLDGTALKQLSFPSKDEKGKVIHFQDRNPHWSPDGKQMAFDSNRSAVVTKKSPLNLRQIFVCDPQGKNMRELPDNMGRFSNQEPSWSPDGEHLVWVTTRNGSADIILATKDGKELRWLALNSKSREFCPSWSADGKHIVYMLQTETPADGVPLELCIRDVETPKTTNGEKRQSNPLTKKPRVLVSYPFWYGLIGVCSANSDYIAFIKKDMPSEIWKIRLDGSNLQRVSDFRKKGISPSYLVAPSWAPKGDRLAFVTKSKRPLAKDVYEEGIWILDVKTGSATEIPLPPVKD